MIHILCLDISQVDRKSYESFFCRVSTERQERAGRYRLFEDQKRCIFSEILLRYAYAQSGGNVDGMRVASRKNEKPYLESDQNFHFNLSHAGDIVALAYGADAVGIDIERTDRRLDRNLIIDAVFNEKEKSWITQNEDPAEQAHRFFRLWTAKESYLKYLGVGFSKDAKSFSVDMEKGRLYDEWKDSVFFTEVVLPDHYVLTVCGKSNQTVCQFLNFCDMVFY